MFFLHASNRTENLLHHLAALIKADPLQSIFEVEYIVIQSQGMERMISQSLADHFTSWCNYKFLLPIEFLKNIAARLGMEITPDSYERNALCWRMEKELRELNGSVYDSLRNYISGEESGQRRYQLARRFAHIFDQYQLMRPEMLKSWERGSTWTKHKAESWQMDLWSRLIENDGENRHRGALLQAVTERLNSENATARFSGNLPRRVSFIGLHILPPFFLAYLNGLAKHCDVHLFQLSPCRNYWGDMKRGADHSVEDNVESSHPLLLSLGKQGRDFQDLLLEQIDFEQEITSYEEPYTPEMPKLLHKLQSDLLAGHLQPPTLEHVSDNSIRIVSCHSKLRELEVLKDHILNILNAHTSLQLREIVVMAPDIQEYAPFIPAVFEEIQHSIADRSLKHKNPYVSIFREFLELFKGRFGWSELLDILENNLVLAQYGISLSDFERVKKWVVSSGIRWGLTFNSRREEGFPFDLNSWQGGLERMLMGYAVDADTQVEGVLPYNEIEGGDAQLLGGICEFVDTITRMQYDTKEEHELSDWASLLTQYVERLFGMQDSREYLELLEIIRTLHDYGLHNNGGVELGVITSWFEHTTTESKSTSGFLKGHLTFCSMLPMRSIPFKAICLIGLNYATFPKSDYHATFDLMRQQPLKGDRSHRADDRYQFLEAILSARDFLYLSYLGQSLKDNASIPASVVVTELLEVLHNFYGISDLVEQHPLHGFNPEYFQEGSRLFSYSEENLKIAKNLRRSKPAEQPWWEGTIEAGEEDTIMIEDLLRFYSNPQRYFVNRSLGILLDGENPLPEESEIFETGGLDMYLAEQQVLEAILQERCLEDVKEKFIHNGVWSLGVPGDLTFAEKVMELKSFAEKVESLDTGVRLDNDEVDLKIGKYKLQGKLENIHENGMLLMRYGKFQGKDLLAGWIHHLINLACSKVYPKTTVLMKDTLVHFEGESLPGPDLEELITTYKSGCCQPSYLLLKPGKEYCLQKLSKRAQLSPLEKAQNAFVRILENGYEPSWSLLYQGGSCEVIGDEFIRVTEKILLPLWSACNGK